jgi:hypothetical protein
MKNLLLLQHSSHQLKTSCHSLAIAQRRAKARSACAAATYAVIDDLSCHFVCLFCSKADVAGLPFLNLCCCQFFLLIHCLLTWAG